MIKKLFELYQPITSMDHPPFTLVHKDESIQIESKEGLLNAIMEAGKSGLTIQRYKGLGEMDPSQLWNTTMNPDTRSLLKVTEEDEVRADEIFRILMGDAVDPRREFIEKNALAVQNLDI